MKDETHVGIGCLLVDLLACMLVWWVGDDMFGRLMMT